MNRCIPKGFWKKALVLTVIGVLLSYFTQPPRQGLSLIVFVDFLFAVGMVFFIYGLMHMVGNMDMFTSLGYGFKAIKRVFRGNPQKASEMKEEYLEYRASRKKHDDVLPLLLIGILLIAASMAIYLIFD